MKLVDPRLLRASRSGRGFLLLIVTVALLTTVVTIAQAFLLTKVIVDAFEGEASVDQLTPTLALLALVFLFRSLLSFLSERYTNQISHSIRAELRQSLIEKYAREGTLLNRRFGAGELSLLATRGVASLEPYFNRFLPQLLIAMIVPVIVATTIAFQDLLSGLVILFTIPLIPLFGALIGRYTSSAMEKKWRTLGILSGYVLDLLHGLTTLKVYGRSKLQGENLRKQTDRYRKETMQVLKVSFLSSFALELIATLSVALLAVEIGIRLVNGGLSLSIGLVILILAPEVYWPIRNVAAQFHASADGVEASKKIFEVLDARFDTTSEEVQEGHEGEEKLKSLGRIKEIRWTDGEVVYNEDRSVTFRWGIATAGKLTVISGPSGSGKTTLINALIRVHPLNEGRIFIETSKGTYRIEELDISYWLDQISWIPQDPHFASGTIESNLKLIKPRANRERLTEVLKAANLELEELPNGLQTVIDDRQAGLSFGQLRRLALARAILKDSPIIICDEPTASLDHSNELFIQRTLKDLSRDGKLVIAITHDPELVKMADRKITLESGRIEPVRVLEAVR